LADTEPEAKTASVRKVQCTVFTDTGEVRSTLPAVAPGKNAGAFLINHSPVCAPRRESIFKHASGKWNREEKDR
jgi:hypothetical protein